jgi:hypothetical protein
MNIREIFDRVTVDENTNVAEMVIDANCSVFNIIHKKWFKNMMEEGNVRHLAKVICRLIKANTSDAETAEKILNDMINDVQGVIKEAGEKDDPAGALCGTIATSSETQTHYTCIENAILIFAMADFCGVKFEF